MIDLLSALVGGAAASAAHAPGHVPALSDDDRKHAFTMTSDLLKQLNTLREELKLPPESMPMIVNMHATYLGQATRQALDRVIEKHAAETMNHAPLGIYSRVGHLSCDAKIFAKNGKKEGVEPIQSNRCPPGRIVEVFEAPQWGGFRAEEIEIHGHPELWLVHEISVGNRHQALGSRTPLKGEGFRKGGIMSAIKLDLCQAAMHFAMTIEYIGSNPEGEPFEATAVGAVPAYPR